MSEIEDTQAANVELTRRAFEAFDPEDAAPILALADQAVEVYMPSDLPNSGTFRGHGGYLEWLGSWLEAWDDFSVEVRGMEPVGERHVVTSAVQTATGKGSGVPVRMEMAYLTEIRDAKVIALHLYLTAEQAALVAEEREGA
ncbi:MAG: nuclear transport factor 2 family protein [Solirubrobacterales bacterium]